MSDTNEQKDVEQPINNKTNKAAKQVTDNTGTEKNEYYDFLSTEECIETANVVRGYN